MASETEISHAETVEIMQRLMDETCGPYTGVPRAIRNVDGKPVAITGEELDALIESHAERFAVGVMVAGPGHVPAGK